MLTILVEMDAPQFVLYSLLIFVWDLLEI